MKKLFIFLLVFLAACTTPRNIPQNKFQSYEQLDSILKAEKVLTYDSLLLKDYETDKYFYTYFFIKDSLTLRWIERGDSVQITKRIYK